MIVVSAGAKAILDIEKTLEVLETRGVPVVAYGSDVMPAFWSRTSRFKAPLRLDEPESDRRLLPDARARSASTAACWSPIRSRRRTRSGRDDGRPHRRRAAGRSENGIAGKAVTPFLLSKSSN